MRHDLTTLKIFVSVAECSNLTRAAEREHLAVSAVSKRIAEFEELVRTPLLQRQARGVSLTPAGQSLLHYARQMLQLVQRMDAALTQFLPEDIESFLACYPLVQISMEERTDKAVVLAVADGTADLGVIAGGTPSAGLTAFPYHRDRLVIGVPKGHPLSRRKSVRFAGGLVNPSYLTLSRDGNRLYTVHGDQSDVSAFAVDRNTGRLELLNRQSTEGKNPVHLALDPTGRYLVLTNHIGASLAGLPLAPDGSLLPVRQRLTLSGPIGPHRIEQKQAKPHANPFDPSGRHVVVPDKGLDRIFSFRFEDGALIPAPAPHVATREGAGPRHLAFHPNKPYAYVVNELDSTVTTYRYSPETAALEPLQILPTLPATFTGNSRAAGIAIDAAGRNLYASNRGHDSIALFRVDDATGLLSFVGAESTLGQTPRFFTLSPDGRLLFALNEDSDSIVTLRVDAATGRITPNGRSVKTGSPVCMVFSPWPRSGSFTAPSRA